MTGTSTFECTLLDGGTMDTVIEVYCADNGETRQYRYDAECAAEYRDEETGELDEESFFSDVVIPDAENDEWEAPTEPAEEDYVICDAPRGYHVAVVGGKFLGKADTRKESAALIRADAGEGWRPAVWLISDHGNAHMLEGFWTE